MQSFLVRLFIHSWLVFGVMVMALLGGAACAERSEPVQQDIRMPQDLPEPVGEAMRVQSGDLDSVFQNTEVILLDVREAWELQRYGTREGYIHIPLVELEDRLGELPRNKAILTA